MARGGLTAEQTATRNNKIIRDRLNKLSWSRIAEKNKLTERAARMVWERYRDQRKPFWRNLDPVQYVFEVLDHYNAAQESLAEAAERARAEGNTREEVQATKAMLDAQAETISLMQAVGMLPKNLGKLQVELDWQFTMKTILQVFDQYKMPDQAKQDLVTLLRGRD